jgi:septal ring factor EnvC (AmiA/AmiB activator)
MHAYTPTYTHTLYIGGRLSRQDELQNLRLQTCLFLSLSHTQTHTYMHTHRRLTESQDELQNLQQRMSHTEGDMSGHQRRAITAETEIKELRRKTEETNALHKASVETISKLRAQLGQAEATISKLEDGNAHLKSMTCVSTARAERLQHQLLELKV